MLRYGVLLSVLWVACDDAGVREESSLEDLVDAIDVGEDTQQPGEDTSPPPDVNVPGCSATPRGTLAYQGDLIFDTPAYPTVLRPVPDTPYSVSLFVPESAEDDFSEIVLSVVGQVVRVPLIAGTEPDSWTSAGAFSLNLEPPAPRCRTTTTASGRVARGIFTQSAPNTLSLELEGSITIEGYNVAWIARGDLELDCTSPALHTSNTLDGVHPLEPLRLATSEAVEGYVNRQAEIGDALESGITFSPEFLTTEDRYIHGYALQAVLPFGTRLPVHIEMEDMAGNVSPLDSGLLVTTLPHPGGLELGGFTGEPAAYLTGNVAYRTALGSLSPTTGSGFLYIPPESAHLALGRFTALVTVPDTATELVVSYHALAREAVPASGWPATWRVATYPAGTLTPLSTFPIPNAAGYNPTGDTDWPYASPRMTMRFPLPENIDTTGELILDVLAGPTACPESGGGDSQIGLLVDAITIE